MSWRKSTIFAVDCAAVLRCADRGTVRADPDITVSGFVLKFPLPLRGSDPQSPALTPLNWPGRRKRPRHFLEPRFPSWTANLMIYNEDPFQHWGAEIDGEVNYDGGGAPRR